MAKRETVNFDDMDPADYPENVTILSNGIVCNDLYRYDILKREMVKACYRYYKLDDSRMSDADYDVGFNNLKYYEARHPDFDKSDSPTQYVGWDERMRGLLDDATKLE